MWVIRSACNPSRLACSWQERQTIIFKNTRPFSSLRTRYFAPLATSSQCWQMNSIVILVSASSIPKYICRLNYHNRHSFTKTSKTCPIGEKTPARACCAIATELRDRWQNILIIDHLEYDVAYPICSEPTHAYPRFYFRIFLANSPPGSRQSVMTSSP
jgi:hypothetical protein